MFVANTTNANVIATRYVQWNRSNVESGNSKITHELKNVKNDNEAVLKKHSFFDKVKAFSGRIFNRIKNVIYLGRHQSKDLEASSKTINDLKNQSLEKKLEKEISDNQIALKILVDHLRKNKSVLKNEGLFREAASAGKLDKFMKNMDEPGKPWIVSPQTENVVICDAIKRLVAMSITTEEQGRLSDYKQVFLEKGTLPPLKDLPEAYRIIQPLMEDMLAVSEDNKMDAYNLATVIAPRLFAAPKAQVTKIEGQPMTNEEQKRVIADQWVETAEKIAFLKALFQAYCQNNQQNVRHEFAA